MSNENSSNTVTAAEFYAMAEGARKAWISPSGTGFIQDSEGVLNSYSITDGARAYLLTVMPADDVQEHIAEYGFTLEEIQAEYARRRAVDAEYLEEQAEEIAQEVSPARSAIASDTCPEVAYRLNLNGLTVDIAGAHGIAATAALELLEAGAEHQQAEESTRAIVKAATSGEHTAVSVDTPNGVLVFTSSTEN